jgi:hypothetical protein
LGCFWERLAARGLEEASQCSWDAIFDALIADYLEAAGRPIRSRWRGGVRRPVPRAVGGH